MAVPLAGFRQARLGVWVSPSEDKFDYEDCPFCDLRRHHCVWLRSEIKRLKSEARFSTSCFKRGSIAPWQVAAVQTTIPPRLYPELRQQLEVRATGLSFHDVKALTGWELVLQCCRARRPSPCHHQATLEAFRVKLRTQHVSFLCSV